MLKRLHSETITNLSARFEIPTGIYRGLFFSFDGTNQAGQTLTSDNLGTIRLLKDGREKVNISFERLVDIVNLEMGVCEESSSAGASFRHVAYLPFHNWHDEDVALAVRPEDKVEVLMDFSQATSTVVASGIMTAYAVLADPHQVTPYEVQFRNHNITVGAAGKVTQLLKVENVAKLYIENDATVLSNLTVTRDGETIFSSVPRDDAYAFAQILRRVETFSASTPMFVVDLNPSENPAGSLSDDIEIEIEAAAAGTLDIVAMSVFPSPKKFEVSLAVRENKLEKKQQDKAQKGATAAVQYIDGEKVTS